MFPALYFLAGYITFCKRSKGGCVFHFETRHV